MILILKYSLVQRLVILKSFLVKTRLFKTTAILVLAIFTTSCNSPNTSTKTNKPKVVVTNSVLCDITQEIAQDSLDLKCLIPAGSDPHVYQAKPDDRKAIEQAQLVLYGGYNFEPSLIKLIKATTNQAPKVAVDELAVPKPQKFEEDGKSETDPHVWHNAQNGVAIVEVVRENLDKIAPNNAAKYRSNAEKMTGELKQLDSWIKAQINTIPANQRKLVTTHDALGYYSSAYGIPIEGALQGISTEEKPTAGRVKDLVKDLKKTGVPMIFAETTINPKLIEAVAKEANLKVSQREILADGLGEKGSQGDTYQKMLIANTETIVEGLGGKFTPFSAK